VTDICARLCFYNILKEIGQMMDQATALRMAKASDVTYYIDHPGGVAACPFYHDVGFSAAGPQTFLMGINAALVGTTTTEIVVAFRGTLPVEQSDWNGFVNMVNDWANDTNAFLTAVPWSAGLVHRGFASSLDSLWTGVLPAVQAALVAAPLLPVVVTGHSKGGAMATLSALRLFKNGIAPGGVYTYGAPRTGNTAFAKEYDTNIPQHRRVENTDDIVPHLPPSATLLNFLATVDPRLSNLSVHAYDPVGLLEFLNWGGGVTEGDSLFIASDRLLHLGKLAVTGQVKQIFEDHKLEKQYLPKLGSPDA
jgi:hypothetical protein